MGKSPIWELLVVKSIIQFLEIDFMIKMHAEKNDV